MGLVRQAKRLAHLLDQHQVRVVLAESCTAGLASATLARVPGISRWHCGSAVTYREATKAAWLDVSASDLQQHSAVSQPVAEQMAVGVLAKTPEATISAAVTGHLGPDAPSELDGMVYVAVAARVNDQIILREVHRILLAKKSRRKRQKEAAAALLERLADQVATR
ncbi:MAG: nicotinamide-nucleotide amidohydrolase family protein [Planctomycetales bacterium]|nr:nicotinamide-nucleotide amidohydrolase family protein [Planctomycetales bacterium]NIM07621.1 nicotinamide-nucleotide amidohydrolase family protein [Planctomycetales bacterium]NIN07127.1 nicotinamide-nucleotide amidohydrolase family protein [Planctomycetales bacterium]NIN76221.1 nicotinamide-nucleotide amidohydrolase family protein [Planctomycetales bacterium]NIO33443.1 nicotinamide-nucleotide amidohydrolase family protein [Planctomycetales bacterium]